MKTFNSIFKTVAILGPLIGSVALGMDVYVPAIPHIQQLLHTHQFQVQLTLSLFLLISGLGQLFIGPITDWLGRQKIMFAGILIFIAGSLACAASQNITQLIVARLFEGLGGCAMNVVAFAIVRDISSGRDSARTYSYLNVVVALSPLFAPFIGAYLDLTWGWRSLFLFLAFLGGMGLMIAMCFIPETLPPSKRHALDKRLPQHYWAIFKHPVFSRYAFCAGAGLAVFFTFFSTSSFILIKCLKISEEQFGFYFAVLGMTMLIGSLLAGQLLKTLSSRKTILIATLLLGLGGISMLAGQLLFGVTLIGYIGPMALMGTAGAFFMGAGTGGALEPFGDRTGTATALLGCLQFLIGSLIGSVVMLWPVTTTTPFAIAAILLSVIIAQLMTSLKGKQYA